jgi:hypothetical protein
VSKGELQTEMLSAQLLLNLAEQLKLPFLQIARQTEANQLSNNNDFGTVQLVAENALRLLENYTLGVRIKLDDYSQKIEPVSVPSLLLEATNQLNPLAAQYGINLDLDVKGRYSPVIADRSVLQAALISLGSALIEAFSTRENKQVRLNFAVHHGRNGIVAGVYANSNKLSKNLLLKGRQLHKNSRQPLVSLTHASGAGIFVADALLNAINLNLYSSRHQGLYGIGVALQPTYQLELVSV